MGRVRCCFTPQKKGTGSSHTVLAVPPLPTACTDPKLQCYDSRGGGKNLKVDFNPLATWDPPVPTLGSLRACRNDTLDPHKGNGVFPPPHRVPKRPKICVCVCVLVHGNGKQPSRAAAPVPISLPSLIASRSIFGISLSLTLHDFC